MSAPLRPHTRTQRALLKQRFVELLPPEGEPLHRFEALDLDMILAATEDVGLSAAERLRLLGAFLEEEHLLLATGDPALWPVLRRVHAAAVVRDRNVDTLTSYAMAAQACWDSGADPTLLTLAERLAREAVAAGSADFHAWFTLGMCVYHAKDDRLDEALAAFTRARSIDPDDGWANLYVAHALHDLERWNDAVDAYTLAMACALPRYADWRLTRSRAQRATCLLKCGAVERAASEFHRVLDAFEDAGEESGPFHGVWFDWPYQEVLDAAEGPLADTLRERVAAVSAIQNLQEERLRREEERRRDESVDATSAGSPAWPKIS